MELVTDRITLGVADALALGAAALQGLGFELEEARTITDHLVDNMLCGYEFAGLPRILAIADHPNFRLPCNSVSIIHDTPTSALIDGGNHVGYVPVLRGASLAAEKARAHGMAIVGVSNCWYSGRNAYYLEHIARQGLIAIHTAASAGNVVPPGAIRPVLGTNPIGFALPCTPDPLIFDMGTASTMWGEVMLYAMLDKQFPEGMGVDAEGRPTTSAREILKGGLLPFGGHKGYGLSLVVQALGILAGSRRVNGNVIGDGFLFIVVDPGILMPREEFHDQLSEMLSQLRALPRQPGAKAVRIPSERAFAERVMRSEQGVTLPVHIHDALRSLMASTS